MQTYEILVRERSVLPNSADMTLVRTSIGIDQVHVLFDNSEWLDFPISITFGNGDTIITQSLTVSALTNIDGWVAEGTCVIPWEVTQDLGAIRVTLQGTDSSGNHIITAYGAPLTVEECGDTASGTVPEPAPSQSEWEQAYADAQVAINQLQSKLDECDDAIEQMESWTMPTATTSTLGGVIPDGETITVDQDGTIHSTGGYELPTAASNVLGGVQVGNTLQINEFGTLNVADEITDAQEVVEAAFDVTRSSGELASVMVKSSVLPSYVDDVIEGYYYNGAFYSDSSHTTAITGETGKIYVDLPTNTTYRWTGTAYVSISNPIDIATQSEAETGTDNTKMMTPLRVKQSVLYNAPAPTAITDAEIHEITEFDGYPDGDSTSY